MSNYDLNQIFLRYSSQSVCGIKPANLFTVPSENFTVEIFREWQLIVNEQGLEISAFKISDRTTMLFIYNKKWIQKIIENPLVVPYLEKKGYSSIHDTNKTIQDLSNRLRSKKDFPHEVGIFLGYPFDDVIKFEEHQGKFCRYCGYWKAYCNPEKAKECCNRFRQCSQMCAKWFDEGYSIPQIIKKYKEAVKKSA